MASSSALAVAGTKTLRALKLNTRKEARVKRWHFMLLSISVLLSFSLDTITR
jgi:hypothetical protein